MPLARPDVREKVEKLHGQLKWKNFPGAHSLLLKGCTNPNTYEATIKLLSKFTLLLDFAFVDPSGQVCLKKDFQDHFGSLHQALCCPDHKPCEALLRNFH